MIAETVEQIEARLIALLQSDTNLYDPTNPDATKRGLTSTSNVAKWRVFLNTIAIEIKTLQDLMGIFETEVEGIINGFAPAVASWIQDRVFKFQYDATTPQVIQLIDFIPQYPTVDETKRIVTRCSVKTDTNKTVKVKVAKQEPPTQLTSGEKTALNSYLDVILPAGIGKNVISLLSDKLWLDAEIFYNGQYSSTIINDVITALNDFLAEIPFDGVVKISAIEDAIQSVKGVTDVVINQVKARDDNTIFANAITVVKEWETYAGYIEQETTSGQTFLDTLIFTVEN